MSVLGELVNYNKLNPRQKEIYNFQRVSALFAEYGYTTIKLSDDWMGADFLAISFDGNRTLKVQLKGRLTFEKKYQSKDIFICFNDKSESSWYLYPHDILLKKYLPKFKNTKSWNKDDGKYHFPTLTAEARVMLEKYRL